MSASSSSSAQLVYALVSIFKDAIDSSEYYTSNPDSSTTTTTESASSSCILIGEYFRGLTISSNGSFVGSFSGTSQQHAQIIRQTCLSIGEKISHVNHKRTLTQATINFHYKVVDNKYLFLVCSDAECPIRICYNFIDDVETQFKRQGFSSNSFGNQTYKAVSNIIKDRMAHYNNFENDKIYKLKNQIDATKDVMISNIDKVIERGEKLETLVERTEQLQDQAYGFRSKSKKLKNVMRKRIIIMSLICILILIIIVIVAVFAGCNFPSFDRCRSTDK